MKCSVCLHLAILLCFGLTASAQKNDLPGNINNGTFNQYIPACINIGLNYHDVWDFEQYKFSTDKIRALGVKSVPKSYDVSYASLIDMVNMEHGDFRMFYEWMLFDIPDYKNLIKGI